MARLTDAIEVPIRMSPDRHAAELCLSICNAYTENNGLDICFVEEEQKYCFREFRRGDLRDES